MKTTIFYLSGTGNSLFIAKKLNDSLENSEIIPILKCLNGPSKKVTSEKVILVFPIYAMTIPIPVRDFLKFYNFETVQYISAIATRLGLYFNDFSRIDKLLKPKKLHSHFILNMGNNDITEKNYKCPSGKELEELEKKATIELNRIIELIKNSKQSREKDTTFLRALPYGDFRNTIIEWLIPKLMTLSKLSGGANYFYYNSKCNGCGICSKVCLSGKIHMVNNKPFWSKKILCHMCYACVNYCPSKAIEIKSIPGRPSFSSENDRYCHPYADFKEIQQQKG